MPPLPPLPPTPMMTNLRRISELLMFRSLLMNRKREMTIMSSAMTLTTLRKAGRMTSETTLVISMMASKMRKMKPPMLLKSLPLHLLYPTPYLHFPFPTSTILMIQWTF